MRLPKGTSYRFLSTKQATLDSVLGELASEGFSGYLRLTVEGKKGIEDGYLLIKDGEVVGAEFQGDESLFSAAAYKKIREESAREGIMDIYRFSDFQIQLSIEENGETLLSVPEKKEAVDAREEKAKAPAEEKAVKEPAGTVAEERPAGPPQVEEPAPSEPAQAAAEPERSVEKDIMEKRKERMELLKKFGLKEPEDDFVEAILQSFKLPTEKEINRTSKELKRELLQRLRDRMKLEELDLYISSSKTEDSVGFDIDVYIKPFNKELEEKIRSTVEDTMKEKLNFPYEKGLTINEAS
ncbi:MAG: DUF2226 domain-containing protein [Methanobacteriota archaeon]|nr:MAG: DUF2226 domain-containing protein [Euryarchaeota archaeon]